MSDAFARFLDKVEFLPNGCWRWTGALNDDGYGLFRYDGPGSKAHQFSFLHFHGRVPPGKEVDHTCKTRACVNPAHLQALTHFENTPRGPHHYLSKRTHCKHGHEFTENNTYYSSPTKRSCKICRLERQREMQRLRAETKGKPFITKGSRLLHER